MKILKPLIVLLFAILTLSMMQSDRKERVQACAEKAGDGAIYLKEFVVSLPKAEKDKAPPVYRQAVIHKRLDLLGDDQPNEEELAQADKESVGEPDISISR